jgi:hypothetical protein
MTETDKKDWHLANEQQFRDELVNHILIIGAFFSLVPLIFTEIRAFSLGWGVRDFIYISFNCILCGTALFRRRIPVQYKAGIMVLLSLITGIIGFYALGILAGGVFYLAIAAVIIAIFYQARIVVIFIVLAILFVSLVAAGFLNNILNLKLSAEILLSSAAHWSTYIACVAFFFLATSITILKYRSAIGQLIKKVTDQHIKLEESNEMLKATLAELKTLKGIIPICASCKKIRNEAGAWDQLEKYICNHSDAKFSHSMCPDCFDKQHGEGAWKKILDKNK